LLFELQKAELETKRQVAVPVIYKDIKLNCGYRINILVDNQIIVELKTVNMLFPVHKTQILSYMKFARK